MATTAYRVAVVVLPAVLIAGSGAWLLSSGLSRSDAEPAAHLTLAVAADESVAMPRTQPEAAATPAAAEPMGRLRILRQSFSRGGLGAKALVTFTLRNDNAFAVKDPEILCEFRSKDGSYATERRRTINDTVDMKSRKTYPYILVGFINVKASRAKCSVLTATRA
jgi:hypothetical protein